MICALPILKLLVLPLAGPSAEVAEPSASTATERPTADAGAEQVAAPAAPALVVVTPPPTEPSQGSNVRAASAPASATDVSDELAGAGYIPGYRAYQGLPLSPLSPRVGAAPGGITPGFGAPMPFGQWTLRYTGFMSASFQGSFGERTRPELGQSRTTFHTPPQTLDEYASFIGTNTMPGQWIGMNFIYGNGTVTANVSLNTWNPSAPTTYYQMGGQLFLLSSYLEFNIPSIGPLRPRVMAGYFGPFYGSIGEYGLGMYTNPIIGSPRGVGELTIIEYRLQPSVTLFLEHGIMASRNGNVPANVIPSESNGGANPTTPSAWIHHAHLILRRTGETEIRTGVHYLYNWAQDDRAQQLFDNTTTNQLVEDYIKDGHLTVVGWDATVRNAAWGYLGAGASYIKGDNAYTLRGLNTFGGEGGTLTDRWWGAASRGTGKLFALALNYSTSLGRMLRPSYSANAPDVSIQAGFVMAYTLTHTLTAPGTSDPNAPAPPDPPDPNTPVPPPMAPTPLPESVDTFNHRLRYKFGLEAVYAIRSWVSLALRADRVAPNSKDTRETFYVLAPRLVFRTNWVSRETFSIIYGRWFYGPDSHGEAGSTISGDVGFDRQLIAFNVNMWW